jgi:hypothetical protein
MDALRRHIRPVCRHARTGFQPDYCTLLLAIFSRDDFKAHPKSPLTRDAVALSQRPFTKSSIAQSSVSVRQWPSGQGGKGKACSGCGHNDSVHLER